MSVVISNIISILKEQHSEIEKLVFCKNCKNSGHCYIENVFSFIHLQNGYCGAGVAKSKSKVDTGFQTLISNLENIDNIPNYQEVLQQANHELRMQNRILKHLTQCKHCTNHKNCDAEDELIRKKATEMFCCVGSSKEDTKNDCNKI